MYIMKCDRCGREQEIKSILPIFSAKEEAPTPGRKFSLMQLDEFREITLCQDCEAALEKWIEDSTCEAEQRCDNCQYGYLSTGDEPCKSCDHRSNWQRKV